MPAGTASAAVTPIPVAVTPRTGAIPAGGHGSPPETRGRPRRSIRSPTPCAPAPCSPAASCASPPAAPALVSLRNEGRSSCGLRARGLLACGNVRVDTGIRRVRQGQLAQDQPVQHRALQRHGRIGVRALTVGQIREGAVLQIEDVAAVDVSRTAS